MSGFADMRPETMGGEGGILAAWSERRRVTVLSVVALATLFAGLGSVPLFDKDEGAFSEASREMLESGDYLAPRLDGAPRYEKPILIYWLQSRSLAVLGIHEFGARFPSALAGLGWAAIVYAFVRGRRDSFTAFWAAFILLTAVQTSLIMKAAIADSVLNLFIAASMLAWYRYYETRDTRWVYVTAAAMALGFLTKGPVAIGIPAAGTLLFCAFRRDVGPWLRSVANPAGWAVFLAIGLPWYAMVYLHDPAMIEQFLLRENLGRARTAMEGHGGSFWYYGPVILVGLLPYTSLAALAIGRALHAPYAGIRVWSGRVPARARQVSALTLYNLVWFFLVLIVFSFVATKLPHYVIYGYTPLIVLMAERMKRPPAVAWFAIPAAAVLALFMALPWLVAPIAEIVKDPVASDILSAASDDFGPGYHALLGVAVAALCGIAALRAVDRPVRIGAVGLVFLLSIHFGVMPAAGRVLQSPVVEAAAYADAHELDVHVYRMAMPSFSFYRERIAASGPVVTGSVVFGQKSKVAQLGETDILFEKNGLVLARVINLAARE